MEELDQRIIQLRNNPILLNNFISSYENYILSIASKVSKKYISRSDDEWSIALHAFHTALNSYDCDRGHFLPYAELLITRSLIDYFRQENRKPLTVDLDTMEELIAPESNPLDLVLEIEAITHVLNDYGFTFMDLTTSSPKAEKTKESCRLATAYLLNNPSLIATMAQTKQLPIKKINSATNLSIKILDRHRKYIIAVTEILNGDYPLLKEYVT